MRFSKIGQEEEVCRLVGRGDALSYLLTCLVDRIGLHFAADGELANDAHSGRAITGGTPDTSTQILVCEKEQAVSRKGRSQMKREAFEQTETWAVQTFGAAEWGDPRRTDRLVPMAMVRAENPAASLPKSMRHWGETLAASRFLGTKAIAHEHILAAHWMQTCTEADQRKWVLLAADTTDSKRSTHKTTTGAGPLGRGSSAQGFVVHTVLIRDAQTQLWLGCRSQEPCGRVPAPKGETQAQESVTRLGTECPGEGSRASKPAMDLRR
jgi:hypothetical protein